MARPSSTKEVLDLGRKVIHVWQENPAFTLSDLKLEDYVKFFNATETLDGTYSQRETELEGLKNKRDDELRKWQEVISRFRRGTRSYYGQDSPQYGQSDGS